MKKFITLFLAVSMMISIFSPIVFAKAFSDISESHWAFKYVNELSDKGVINGYEDGTFKPEGNVTNAEFIKLLMVADMGEEHFKEMPTEEGATWYRNYFKAAFSGDVLYGAVDEETANEPTTREDMVAVLYNICIKDGYLQAWPEEFDQAFFDKLMKEGKYVKIGDATYFNKAYFEDSRELTMYTQIAINQVSDLGLIKGYEDDTFRPENNMTRAEVSTVISRFMELKASGK